MSSLAVTAEARPRINSVALIPSIMTPSVSSKKTASGATCGIISYYIPKDFREFLPEGLPRTIGQKSLSIIRPVFLLASIFEAQLGV